jgi:hypothetical protein
MASTIAAAMHAVPFTAGVIPVFVFDGANLPAKAATEAGRRDRHACFASASGADMGRSFSADPFGTASHICTGAGSTPPTSAPGLGSPLTDVESIEIGTRLAGERNT